jgi:tetratricopeptide (TPR) repeat protein
MQNADQALQQGQPQRALAEAQRALQYQPGWSPALLAAGMGAYYSGQHTVAQPYLADALRQDSSLADAWYALAQIGLATDAKQAEQYARFAIALRPEWPEAWGVLGVALFRQGQAGPSVVALDYAVQLAPRAAVFRYNRAVALHRNGQAQVAWADLDTLRGLLPQPPADEATRLAMLAQLGFAPVEAFRLQMLIARTLSPLPDNLSEVLRGYTAWATEPLDHLRIVQGWALFGDLGVACLHWQKHLRDVQPSEADAAIWQGFATLQQLCAP